MDERFIREPNLPEAPVSLLAVSKKYAPLLKPVLRQEKIQIVSPEPEPGLDSRIAHHPDILLCHLGEDRVIASKEVAGQLRKLGFAVYGENVAVSGEYPEHIALNAAIIKTNVFHDFRHTAKELLYWIENKKLIKRFVRQGYTKCSICVINDRAILTEDTGIHEAAQMAGINSLLIEKGYVALEGFPYGFIGGAAGLIAPGKLAFTGSFEAHPQKDRILRFIKSNRTEPIYLTDKLIFDCGSLLPLKEYCEGTG